MNPTDIYPDYVRPTVRMDATEEELSQLDGYGIHVVQHQGDPQDIQLPTEDDYKPSERHQITQKALLLHCRLFCAILEAGNPTHVAMAASRYLFDEIPPKAWERALDWCDPDFSDVTGEATPTKYANLSPETIQILIRAKSAYWNCARTVHVVAQWIMMGAQLGIDMDRIGEAAATQLDMGFIIEPTTCECDECAGVVADYQSEQTR